MKARIEDSVADSRRDEKSHKVPLWLILVAVLSTIIGAYLVYAGGNYAGVQLVMSEQPIGHTLGWMPLTTLFIGLLIVNPISQKLSKKKLFTSRNLVLLFTMVIAGASAVSRGATLAFLSIMGLAHEAASNPMAFQPFLERFSPLAIPFGGGTFSDTGMDTFMGYMMGQSTVPWDVWLMPCILWGIFAFAFFLLGIGMATVVRKRWTEVEHLRYPVVALATEMISQGGDDSHLLGPLWRNKLTWIGFVPGFIFVFYTQLQAWLPGLPQILVGYGNWLIFRPLYDSLRGTTLGAVTSTGNGFAMNYWGISPLWLGVAYLIPPHGTLISYVLTHLLRIIPNYIFYSTGRVGTFSSNLRGMWDTFAYGAIFGLGIFMIYLMRNELKMMFRGAFGGVSDLDDSGEAVPYKTAIYLILGSSLFIVLYTVLFLRYKVWMSLLYILMYIPIVLGTTRMRAYAATMWERNFGTYNIGIQTKLLPGMVGQKAYGITGMISTAILGEFDLCERHMSTINLLESWKLADEEGVSKKAITKGMTIMFMVGTAIFFYTSLNFIYKGHGLSTVTRKGYTYRLYRPLAPLTYQGAELKGPMMDTIIFFISGIFLMWFNSWMRLRFLWWPLEPVGFAWGARYAYEEMGNFLIMGLIKGLIVRYGGTSLYNKLRPVFLGMIMGWAVAAVITNSVNVLRVYML